MGFSPPDVENDSMTLNHEALADWGSVYFLKTMRFIPFGLSLYLFLIALQACTCLVAINKRL